MIEAIEFTGTGGLFPMVEIAAVLPWSAASAMASRWSSRRVRWLTLP
jgi:hypothetical protein